MIASRPSADRSEAEDYSAWGDDDAPADALTEVAPRRLVVSRVAQGERLDKWLASAMPEHSRARLKLWIEEGAVVVNGQVPAPRRPVWEGDIVEVCPRPSNAELAFRPETMPLSIVFEDEDIMVVNKPAGLVVHPAAGNWSGTLLNGLLAHDPGLARVARAGIVHRLDKDTSGLMVVARNPAAQTSLVRQLQQRSVKRHYLAIVLGEPPHHGTIHRAMGRSPRDRLRMAVLPDSATGAKPAVTRFRRAAVGQETRSGAIVSLVVLALETGRTHQIRVHMQSIGYPLVGDPLYGSRADRIGFARQALHAARLGLMHPVTGQALQWSAALPDDLSELAERCGLDAAVMPTIEEVP